MDNYTATLTIPLTISATEYVVIKKLLDKEQPTENETNEVFILAARFLIRNLDF